MKVNLDLVKVAMKATVAVKTTDTNHVFVLPTVSVWQHAFAVAKYGEGSRAKKASGNFLIMAGVAASQGEKIEKVEISDAVLKASVLERIAWYEARLQAEAVAAIKTEFASVLHPTKIEKKLSAKAGQEVAAKRGAAVEEATTKS